MANGYTNEAKAEEAGNMIAKRLFDARHRSHRPVEAHLSEREVAVLCRAAFELGVQCAISAMHKAEGGGES